MKTPKRTSVSATLNPKEWPFDPPHHAGDMLARWTRKNKIAQLKRTINKYRDCTNLPFYCHELHAYKRLQELKYPGKKATAYDWDIHIRFLKTIHCHIWQAIHKAEAERDRLTAEYSRAKNGTAPNS